MSTGAHSTSEGGDLLTLAQACERLKVSRYGLHRRVKSGDLTLVTKPEGDRRLRYIDASELEAYLRSGGKST